MRPARENSLLPLYFLPETFPSQKILAIEQDAVEQEYFKKDDITNGLKPTRRNPWASNWLFPFLREVLANTRKAVEDNKLRPHSPLGSSCEWSWCVVKFYLPFHFGKILLFPPLCSSSQKKAVIVAQSSCMKKQKKQILSRGNQKQKLKWEWWCSHSISKCQRMFPTSALIFLVWDGGVSRLKTMENWTRKWNMVQIWVSRRVIRSGEWSVMDVSRGTSDPLDMHCHSHE